MGKKRTIGILFITISILIAFSNLTIVGAVIGARASNSLSWITIVFFVIGVLLVVRESEVETNYAQQILDRNKYVPNPREMIKIARKSGEYELVGGHKEGTRVYYGDKVLTIIPNHGTISKGTSKSILESLATGESSFRKRSRT